MSGQVRAGGVHVACRQTCAVHIDVDLEVASRVHGQEVERGAAITVVQHHQHCIILQPGGRQHVFVPTYQRKHSITQLPMSFTLLALGGQLGDQWQVLLQRRMFALP